MVTRRKTCLRFDYVSQGRLPAYPLSLGTQIRLTSPKISKPDNLCRNKITQPFDYAQLTESGRTPPKGSKPNRVYISLGTKPDHLNFSLVVLSNHYSASQGQKPNHLHISQGQKPNHLHISQGTKPDHLNFSLVTLSNHHNISQVTKTKPSSHFVLVPKTKP